MRLTRGRSLAIAVFAVSATLVLAAGSAGAPAEMASTTSVPAVEGEALVEVHLRDRTQLDKLVASGADLAEYLRKNDDGTLTVNVFATRRELARLADQGYELGATIEDESTWRARLEERAAAIAREQLSRRELHARFQATDEVRVARADYFVNYAGKFLSVEAKSSLGSGAAMTLRWDTGPGTEPGAGGSQTMSAFVDAGQYQYHRTLVRVTTQPDQIQVTSSGGGSAQRQAREWIPDGPAPPVGYQQDFITHYMDPTEAYDRIESLAEEDERSGTDIVEIVELPYLTNGYRRKAQALLGNTSANSSVVVVTSTAWGHEGGNDTSIELRHPVLPSQELRVDADTAAKKVVVNLGTNAAGVPSSTAAQVVGAINGHEGARSLLVAETYRGNAGIGTVLPAPETTLTDSLLAPETISREPWRVRAIRIGKHRDGSKVGVMAYHQEHAREWVTPLVAVETAERLFRNYGTDPLTTELVDNLDIFIVPSVNPDGAHYSFYDFASQRKNMTNYCNGVNWRTGNPYNRNDPGSRNTWGVDINRNYQIGSMFDGYSGASDACTSEVFTGLSEHSEPESRNVQWLADEYPNIKFSMNTHTYGGYFMWSPGAYKTPGRVTLPAPNLGIESYFFAAADIILQRIKSYRGTVILPGRTGPIADVLYSAAGNSADELWYRKGVIAYSFEAGADRFTSTSTGTAQTAVGFMPAFAPEGHDEAMEFASGTIGLLEAALLYARDQDPPEATLVPGASASRDPIAVRFETDEAAVIHYTLDGSQPTFDSPTYESQGRREGGQTLTFPETTTVKWFAHDAAGNASPVRTARYVVDAVAPVTTATLAPAERSGWYASPTVTLAADDGTAGVGVDSTEYRLDGGDWASYAAPFDVASSGEHTLEYRSTDELGNQEEARSLAFRVDATLPKATIAAPEDGSTLRLGAVSAAAYGCTDSPSGIAECAGTVADGQPVDTASVGPKTFTVNAVDVAGNRATATASYTVVWPFRGFLAPIVNPPSRNEVRAGSAVRLSFDLGGSYGTDVVAAGYPQSVPINCFSREPKGPAAPASAKLTFADGIYALRWKTNGGWKGTCRQFVLKLRDTTIHRADFRFS